MNKEDLKKYFHNYGEIKFLQDLATIFNDMKLEWATSNSEISETFLIASGLIEEASKAIESCEDKYQSDRTLSSYEEEFAQIQAFFSKMDSKEFKNLYENNQDIFSAKLMRLKELKDIIDAESKR